MKQLYLSLLWLLVSGACLAINPSNFVTTPGPTKHAEEIPTRNQTEDDEIRVLFRKLGFPNFKDRENAYNILRSKGEKAIPFAHQNLNNKDPEIQSRSERLLKAYFQQLSTPPFLERLPELKRFYSYAPDRMKKDIERLFEEAFCTPKALDWTNEELAKEISKRKENPEVKLPAVAGDCTACHGVRVEFTKNGFTLGNKGGTLDDLLRILDLKLIHHKKTECFLRQYIAYRKENESK